MKPFPYEAIIFDIDGTLFQTEKVALPAFQRVFATLREKGLYQDEPPTDEKIKSVFGLTIPELWKTLLPDASDEVRHLANELLAEAEFDLLEKGQGACYPGTSEALHQLKSRGVKLFTATNGEQRYAEAVIHALGLTPHFTELYSAGYFQTEKKADLVANILKRENIRSAVMVGDRRSDIEAGIENHLPTIGCDFGFADKNELEEATRVIDHFDQLLDQIDQLAAAEGQKVK